MPNFVFNALLFQKGGKHAAVIRYVYRCFLSFHGTSRLPHTTISLWFPQLRLLRNHTLDHCSASIGCVSIRECEMESQTTLMASGPCKHCILYGTYLNKLSDTMHQVATICHQHNESDGTLKNHVLREAENQGICKSNTVRLWILNLTWCSINAYAKAANSIALSSGWDQTVSWLLYTLSLQPASNSVAPLHNL